MSDRFVLIDSYNATKVLGATKHNIYDRCVAVVDTATTPPKILCKHYDDSDRTVRFAYEPLTHHLNKLARELECERAEVRSLKAANEKQHAKIA